MMLWTMTLRAVVPERKTSEVTPSEMGEQLGYEPMVMPDWGAGCGCGCGCDEGEGEGEDRGEDEDGGFWCLLELQAEVYSSWVCLC